MKKKFTTFLIIWFFVLLLVVVWIMRKNSFSKDILELEILASESAEAGEEIEYIVKYKNKGEVRLEDAKLVFEYPEHSLTTEGESLRITKDLDDIYPGQEVSLRFRGQVFGKKGDIRVAKTFLNYRPKNLESSYESETTHTLRIDSVPLTFDFDMPSNIEPGRTTTFSINYFSNSSQPFFNLGVRVEYPSGFKFVSSKPAGVEGSEWEIGLLNKAEGGRIEISGILSGDVGQQKVFRGELGVWHNDEFIALKEVFKGVDITRPRISVFQQINGSSEYVANPGDLLHYEIFFRNIGDQPFENLFLIARLEGQLFDFDSIKSINGRFNKGDNSLVWDWRDVSKLRFLGQGEEGKIEFWIDLKKPAEMENVSGRNFILKNEIVLSQVREEFITKINSGLVISQRGFFNDEVFGNSGPLPPKVDQETTYTISWQVKNSYNDLKNVKVKAFLPENVKPTGEIFPQKESSKFAFDSDSREIVWDVSEVKAGEGTSTPGPNVSFQVVLTPTEDQAGQVVAIIEQARVYGEDQFTGEEIESSAEMIDSTLPDDETIDNAMGKVQPS